jgi:hypothetical protein
MNSVKKVASAQSIKLLNQACGGEVAVSNVWKLTSDSLRGDGITSTMLASPKKGEENVYENLQFQIKNSGIVPSFTKEVQALLVKDTKTLSDTDKATKRYWQQQVGSLYNKVRSHLAKAENEASGVVRVAKTDIEKIKASLLDAYDRARKIEEPNFDVIAFGKLVKQASAMVQ